MSIDKLAAYQNTVIQELFVPSFLHSYNIKAAATGLPVIDSLDKLQEKLAASTVLTQLTQELAAKNPELAKEASAFSTQFTQEQVIDFCKKACAIPAVVDSAFALVR